jgi:hypothetical protein
MKAIIAVTVALMMMSLAWVEAQSPKGTAAPPSLFPAGYADHQTLTANLRRIEAAHPRAIQVGSLAKTQEGRDVWIATIGRPEAKGKPAVLIVANLEADHVVGSQVALGLIERMVAADGKNPAVSKLIDAATIYVVPRLNPDGAERLLHGSPRFDIRANLTPIDRDRDGKSNEDGPNDLDGDGLALTMRARNAHATLVPDAKDPRILRKADPAKGEHAVFSELAEGIDDDGDGLLNEDPPGGVNLNRNWPHGWTEYNPETGVGPASEPEVHALIRFAYEHPEIAAVWTFGLNDNLRAEAKGIAPADQPYFAELTRQFNKATGQTTPAPATPKAETPKAEPARAEPRPAQSKGQGRGQGRGTPPPSAAPASTPTVSADGATTDGAMSEWAYHQFGVIGLASRLWAAPEGATGEGEARWLDWNDKIMNGRAFVPFHPVDHPTLGKVEVGGWKPGVKINPPVDSIAAIADAGFVFLKDLAGRLPALRVKESKVVAKGGGVFEITATIENTGYFPTAIAQGQTTRKAPPVLVRLRLGTAKLLAGKGLNRIDSLPGSGGTREFRWLVLAPDDVKSIMLDISSPKAGSVQNAISLR